MAKSPKKQITDKEILSMTEARKERGERKVDCGKEKKALIITMCLSVVSLIVAVIALIMR